MSKDLSEGAKALCKQYGLSLDQNDGDIFISPRFKIITRQGIDKIMTAAKIEVGEFTTLFADPFEIQLMNTYSIGDNKITTTACASVDRIVTNVLERSRQVADEDTGQILVQTKQEVIETLIKKGNVQQKPAYLPEMAEKRCNSRGVLKLTGFYDHGFYGQDEADDFDNAVKSAKYGGKSSGNSSKEVRSKML